MKYDSTEDTEKHIAEVAKNLSDFSRVLQQRGRVHDHSKLASPEKEGFDSVGERLKSLTYGSDEYKASLEELKPILQHHYQNNDHHPEYHKNGIDDMDLFQLVEMVCDWKAAVKRHADGDINKSVEINSKRFNMSEQLTQIFRNTIRNWK